MRKAARKQYAHQVQVEELLCSSNIRSTSTIGAFAINTSAAHLVASTSLCSLTAILSTRRAALAVHALAVGVPARRLGSGTTRGRTFRSTCA